MIQHINLLDENSLGTPDDVSVDLEEQSGKSGQEPGENKRTLSSDISGGKSTDHFGKAGPDTPLPRIEKVPEREKKSHLWLWFFLLLVIAAGLIYILYFRPLQQVNYRPNQFRAIPSGLWVDTPKPLIQITQTTDVYTYSCS